MSIQHPAGMVPSRPTPHEYLHVLQRIKRPLGGRLRKYQGTRDAAHRTAERVAKRARILPALNDKEMHAHGRAATAKARLEDPGRRTGPDHEIERGLSRPAYVAVMLVVAILSFAIDRSAMLVLLLPLGLTTVCAILCTVTQLFAAHFGGHSLRREHHAISPLIIGGAEIIMRRAGIAIGVAVAAVLGVIRANSGNLLAGILFTLIGVLAFVCAVVASYFFSHDGVAAVERTERDEATARSATARAMKHLLKAIARWRRACHALISAAGSIELYVDHALGAAEDTWSRNHPGEALPARPEIPALHEISTVARGVLPASLDITKILAEAGIDPDSVLS